jgi:uncharacterized protein (TIGR03382 family)
MHKITTTVCLAVAIILSSGVASASSVFSFTGTFPGDDYLQDFSFTSTGGTVTILSLGYAGGTNGNGVVIPAGGFNTVFSVFDPSGALVAQNSQGVGVPVDPTTGAGLDALIEQPFAAGTYTLVLSEYDNLANGPNLSNGFSETGNGNFTCPNFAGTSGPFCDITGSERDGNWAVDISGVSTASIPGAGTPEPATFFLAGGAAAVLALVRRRKASTRQA